MVCSVLCLTLTRASRAHRIMVERNRRLEDALCAKYSASASSLPELILQKDSLQKAERFKEALQQEIDLDAEVLQMASD